MSDSQTDQFFNSDSLSEDFFVDVVEKKLKIPRESFEIKLVLISPATGKNENYASIVYRAKIKLRLVALSESKVVDVIMKASLTNIPDLSEVGAFTRETLMYKDILSSFESMWLEKSGEEIRFGPQGIKFMTEPYEIIVLEDLKASGFVMLDRIEGLTVQQGKVLLAKLAKFHAVSAVRYQNEGILNACLDRESSQVAPDSDFFKGFIRMFDELIKALDRYGGYQSYVEKFKKFNQKSLLDAFLNDDSPMKCGLKVLIHGDMWINNAMFKIDEATKEATDVRLIDFQMGFWASPIIDVMSLVLTSVHEDLLVKHFDELIEAYHRALSEALQIIGYEQPIPTLSEMFDEIMDKSELAVLIPSYMFFIKYSFDEAIDLAAMLSETDEDVLHAMYQRIYTCPILQKSLKKLLPFLDERGYFEPKFEDTT